MQFLTVADPPRLRRPEATCVPDGTTGAGNDGEPHVEHSATSCVETTWYLII
jgi:hypothetical protein